MENQRWETSVPPPDEIKPKKLVNPVKESIARQNLHRELLFNQKIGKEVLNQKSELQRALEKKKMSKKEISNPSEIETTVKKIMFHNTNDQQEQNPSENNKKNSNNETNNEFQQIHAKIFKK